MYKGTEVGRSLMFKDKKTRVIQHGEQEGQWHTMRMGGKGLQDMKLQDCNKHVHLK